MWQAYAGVKARPRSAQVVVVVHRLGLEGCDVGAYAGSVLSMAKAAAAEVDAGGRAVRVSSPDRIIFEATRDTAEVTKLMVAEYFVSVGDGLMRAPRERPTALERWPSGVREGMRLATGRSEEHTSELQSLMRISYAVFCL